MDQLKETLAKLGKHGFWIACGLVTVISLGVWWMATGSLVEQYAAEAAKLDAATSAISSIQSQMATHPNDASHEVMEELISAQEEEVLEAWRMQYEEQQDILVWPPRLGQEFIDVFAPLVPIELNFQEFPVPEELEKERTYRERYRDYIKDVMGPMAEKAGAKWKAEFNAASNTMGGYGMGEGSGMSDYGGGSGGYGGEMGYGSGAMGGRGVGVQEKPPLVEWPTQSQEALLSDLFPWRGNIPTTLEVLYSQENLWVLDQLLQIVADTNGDATQRFQAKIHEIQKIGIGRSATRANGIISPVGGARGGMGMGGEGSGYGMEMGGEMGGEMGYGSEMSGGAMMGEGSGMGGEMGYGMGQEPVQIDPAEGRYVNVDYEPIEASRVRSAMVSNSPEDAALAVAKRIPVMLRLKMDQRYITELLAACGNASLMVEVRQVRIEPKGTAGGTGGYGGGGYSSMGGSSGGYGASPGGEMMGEGYGGGSGSYGGGMSGGMNAQQTFPMDMVVEVYGIIYLFNPPAVERLGVEQVNESTVIDGKSMAEEESDPGVIAAPIEAAVDPPAEPDLPTQPAEGADGAANGETAGQGQPQAGQPQPAPGQPQAGQPQAGQPQAGPGQPQAGPGQPQPGQLQGAPVGAQPAPGASQPAPGAP